LARQVLQEAASLVGIPHHLSVHPGGVVISSRPADRCAPVQWSPKGFHITQYDHHDVEALGLPKLDLLGIRALTVLADAVRLVRRDHDPGFRLEQIPLNDQATAHILAHGETMGVFQCESQPCAGRSSDCGHRPCNDLAVTNAFFKPGPSLGGMAHTFVRRYRARSRCTIYTFSGTDPRFNQRRAHLPGADPAPGRRDCGAELGAGRPLATGGQVQSRCHGRDGSPICAWLPEAAARWAGHDATAGTDAVGTDRALCRIRFNRGHAMAYADVSYRSAYLKAIGRAAFMCARLMDWGGFHHPAMYMAEAIRLGIRIRPPHVNHSERTFSLA